VGNEGLHSLGVNSVRVTTISTSQLLHREQTSRSRQSRAAAAAPSVIGGPRWGFTVRGAAGRPFGDSIDAACHLSASMVSTFARRDVHLGRRRSVSCDLQL
jgi:hypothetical protein